MACLALRDATWQGDVPSDLLFQTYGSICLSQFFVPMWDCAARRSWISSSVAERTEGSFDDMLGDLADKAQGISIQSSRRASNTTPESFSVVLSQTRSVET